MKTFKQFLNEAVKVSARASGVIAHSYIDPVTGKLIILRGHKTRPLYAKKILKSTTTTEDITDPIERTTPKMWEGTHGGDVVHDVVTRHGYKFDHGQDKAIVYKHARTGHTIHALPNSRGSYSYWKHFDHAGRPLGSGSTSSFPGHLDQHLKNIHEAFDSKPSEDTRANTASVDENSPYGSQELYHKHQLHNIISQYGFKYKRTTGREGDSPTHHYAKRNFNLQLSHNKNGAAEFHLYKDSKHIVTGHTERALKDHLTYNEDFNPLERTTPKMWEGIIDENYDPKGENGWYKHKEGHLIHPETGDTIHFQKGAKHFAGPRFGHQPADWKRVNKHGGVVAFGRKEQLPKQLSEAYNALPHNDTRDNKDDQTAKAEIRIIPKGRRKFLLEPKTDTPNDYAPHDYSPGVAPGLGVMPEETNQIKKCPNCGHDYKTKSGCICGYATFKAPKPKLKEDVDQIQPHASYGKEPLVLPEAFADPSEHPWHHIATNAGWKHEHSSSALGAAQHIYSHPKSNHRLHLKTTTSGNPSWSVVKPPTGQFNKGSIESGTSHFQLQHRLNTLHEDFGFGISSGLPKLTPIKLPTIKMPKIHNFASSRKSNHNHPGPINKGGHDMKEDYPDASHPIADHFKKAVATASKHGYTVRHSENNYIHMVHPDKHSLQLHNTKHGVGYIHTAFGQYNSKYPDAKHPSLEKKLSDFHKTAVKEGFLDILRPSVRAKTDAPMYKTNKDDPAYKTSHAYSIGGDIEPSTIPQFKSSITKKEDVKSPTNSVPPVRPIPHRIKEDSKPITNNLLRRLKDPQGPAAERPDEPESKYGL